jgi:A/G-specific adenine glycosylase
MNFSARLIEWQRLHGRHDLPWQGTREPYRIWLAEVMLQQTQVATVIPYFLRFIGRFADVRALAAAPADAVMAAWAGLGYYGRARNLHRCAQVIVAEHGGVFPRTAAALAQLPGIGRSTAAAIAAFAYGERAAILDGNVRRVFARHFGVDGDPAATATQRRLWQIADELLPAGSIEAYTQGLMDLGATLCTPRRPRCPACPLAETCVAARSGRVHELPAPRRVRRRPLRSATLILAYDRAGAVLLERRAPTGIWGGLLSLPQFDADLSDDEVAARLEQRFAVRGRVVGRQAATLHEFTHFTLQMQPCLVDVVAARQAGDAGEHLWLHPHELEAAALPAPVRRLLAAALAAAAAT